MTTENVTLTLLADTWQALEDGAYVIDGNPKSEADVCRTVLDLMPRPRYGDKGGPIDEDFPLYALRHFIGMIMNNRTPEIESDKEASERFQDELMAADAELVLVDEISCSGPPPDFEAPPDICPRCGAHEFATHHELCQSKSGMPTKLSDDEVRRRLFSDDR